MSLLLDSILNNANLQINVGYSSNNSDKYDLYEQSIISKELSLFDKFYISDKNVWKIDTVLNEYPNSNSHYIVDNKVYLCIQNNNNNTSTQKPFGTSVFNFMTTDNYVWRYLFTLQTDDMVSHIRINAKGNKPPVKNAIAKLENYNCDVMFDSKPILLINSDNGTGCVIDYDYDDLTKKVSNIIVNGGGNNYKNNDYIVLTENKLGDGANITYNLINGELNITGFTPGGNYTDPKIHVLGDGSGATVNYTVANGSFTDISVKTKGSNYTWITLVIAPSKNSFISKVVLESPNGFGYKPVNDINHKLLISKEINVNVDTTINYIIVSDKAISNEYPEIYIINNIPNKTLSKQSTNLIQVVLDEAL